MEKDLLERLEQAKENNLIGEYAEFYNLLVEHIQSEKCKHHLKILNDVENQTKYLYIAGNIIPIDVVAMWLDEHHSIYCALEQQVYCSIEI